jgi:hypothetical protein
MQEENHEEPEYGQSVYRPTSEPRTSKIWSISAANVTTMFRIIIYFTITNCHLIIINSSVDQNLIDVTKTAVL